MIQKRMFTLLLFWFGLHLALVAESSSSIAALQVAARSFQPGEPVLVLLENVPEASDLRGSFLDHTFPLLPAGEHRWSGWTLIPLDAEVETQQLLQVDWTTDGVPFHQELSVTIRSKEFPEESLKVASKYVTPDPEVEARLAKERAELKEIYELRTDLLHHSPFLRPVPGKPTSVFGTRRIFNGEPRAPHSGWDLDAEVGDPVIAAGKGRVVLAKDLYYSGGTVILDHGGGLFTLYAHLSSIKVKVGSVLQSGDLVGAAGATGRVTGPHLHWGAKIGAEPFDPAALLSPELFRFKKD